MIAILRRSLIVALAGALAYGGWQLTEEPADPFLEQGEELLRERLHAYTELRVADDWVAIWEMVDPEERQKTDLANFMAIYAQGLLKTHAITERDIDINFNTGRANVAVTTDAELVVSKLPPQYRASLRVDDPADLQRSMQHDLAWVWRDGDWYFSLDPEVLTGTDGEGRTVSSLGGS